MVWDDHRNGVDADVYYSPAIGGGEQLILSGPGNQFLVDIDGMNIVYTDGPVGGNHSIFMVTLLNNLSIHGTVTDNGAGLGGVTMTLSGDSSATTATAADGTYSFNGLPNGNYTITPGLSGYGFTPASRPGTISGMDINGIDFSVNNHINQIPESRVDGAVSGDQRYPWADYNADTGEYLALWQDKRNGANDDIYGVRLDQNGNRIGSDFAVSTAAGHQQRVTVKAGGGGYLAVWHDLRNQSTNGADIYGAWIAGDGTVGPEMAICACAKDQWNPVAGYDPLTNTFLVVWLDGRGSTNNQTGNPNDDYDLYGVVIPAGGSESLTPFPVVSENNGQRGPQIGYDYGNHQ